MVNWNNLEPTQKQKEAIRSYEQTWGVTICCNSKQDAHDVISMFVKDRNLTFKDGIIVGTNVAYTTNKVTETPIPYLEEKYNIYIDTIGLDKLISILRNEKMLSRGYYDLNSWAFETIYGSSWGQGADLYTGELTSDSIKKVLVNILKKY